MPEQEGAAAMRLSLLQEILHYGSASQESPQGFFHKILTEICAKEGFDRVLSAFRRNTDQQFRVVESQGFPPAFKRGRILRLAEPGLCQRAVTEWAATTTPEGSSGSGVVPLFNIHERVGFDVRSAVAIPWQGGERGAQGLVVLACDVPRHWNETDREFWKSLGDLLCLIQASEQHRDLLVKADRYDGESGVYSEGYFHEVARKVFDRVKVRGSSLTLILAIITDIHLIYRRFDRRTTNALLESFADALTEIVPREGISGKFQTGGFGLLVPDLSLAEMIDSVEQAYSLLGKGGLVTNADDVDYHVRIGAAHYPEETEDLEGLWREAESRLGLD